MNGIARYILLFPAVLLMVSFPMAAMSETLTGSIRDAETGKPVEGASLYLSKGKTGGITSEKGRFSLSSSLSGSDTLRIRRLDYRSVDLPVTLPGSIDIELVPEIHVIDTVTIKARRPDETPASERTSASVNVIERENIPERAATINEVLDSEVGVDIRSLGGSGALSEISVRGSTTEQVSVYVDGVPLTAGGSGVSGLAFVPVSQVKRIEVFRGSSPGSFGTGAIGGIVNISTARENTGAGVEASLSYGSFNSTHQTAMTHFGAGNCRVLLSAGRNASDNDFRFYDDRGTTIDKSDDGWETRVNSDFESVSMLARVEAGSSEGHNVMAKISSTGTDRGVSGLGRRPAYNARLSSDGLLVQARHRYGEAVDTQAWLMREKRGFYDPKDEAGRRGPQDTDDTIIVRGLNMNLNRIFGPVLGHGSFEVKRESFDSSDAFDSSVTPKSHRTSFGIGAEGEIMLKDGTLWLTPRVYQTFVDDTLHDTGILLAQSPVDSMLTVSRSITTLALGLRWKARDSLTLRLNGGSYPRLPEFGELFGDTGDIVGNTKLTEERGTTIDAGFHFAPEKRSFALDTSLFYRKAEDLIQRRNYGDYLISENIGKAEITGVETWATGAFLDNVTTYRLSLAYQDAVNRSDETLFRKQRYYGKQLPYHPEWKGAASLTARLHKHLSAIWSADYESECFRGPSNLPDEKLEARTIQSLSFRISLPKGADMLLEADNITDNHAPDRWGYPKPGRGYYVTLSWNIERNDDASK